MIIRDSAVDLFSSHASAQRVEVNESLRIRFNNENSSENSERIDISMRARQVRQLQQAYDKSADELRLDELTRQQLYGDPEILIRKLLLDMLEGRRLEYFAFHMRIEVVSLRIELSGGEVSADASAFSLAYDYSETYIDEETTGFAANGMVTLASGESLDFSTELHMHREIRATNSFSLRIGDPIDPLALNVNGGAVELGSESVAFDLDMDGVADQVAGLAHGSYFLARDHNHDGVINDGSELFGPRGGDGFAELSAYDADGNGWIDEADPVYRDLSLWQNSSGELDRLSDYDIGAIYLDSIESPFLMLGDDLEADALVRESGVYLKESGNPGVIQQIDLLT